jgi:hypothetical protein
MIAVLVFAALTGVGGAPPLPGLYPGIPPYSLTMQKSVRA